MWIAVLPFRLLITPQIQVLGTEFNVEAYEKEDEVNTTLVSGKVQFQYDSERGKKRMDLLPGEKITYNSISGEVFVFHGRLFCRIFLGKRVRLYFIKLLLKKRYVC